MRVSNRISNPPGIWPGKALLRLLLLLVAAAAVAAFASSFGISHDYAHLRASLLAGAPGGYYHTLASRLAGRAGNEHGSLIVVPTAGSIENITPLVEDRARCAAGFGLMQDGIPVSADAGLEMLGRLPEPESLLLLGRQNRTVTITGSTACMLTISSWVFSSSIPTSSFAKSSRAWRSRRSWKRRSTAFWPSPRVIARPESDWMRRRSSRKTPCSANSLTRLDRRQRISWRK
jgi:hypothetical protein